MAIRYAPGLGRSGTRRVHHQESIMTENSKTSRVKRPRVLVVGTSILTETFCQHLKEQGFELVRVSNEEEGLEFLKRKKLLVLVDEISARDQAVQFIRRISTVIPGAPMVVLSMNEDLQYVAYMFSLGIAAYVWAGDVDLELVPAMLAVTQTSRQYLSSHIRCRL
jgi:DNA-binding NarL/FixJ family response regulator